MRNLFVQYNDLGNHFGLQEAAFERAHEKMNNQIDEDEYYLCWEDFHQYHPNVARYEYEAKQKELQEV